MWVTPSTAESIKEFLQVFTDGEARGADAAFSAVGHSCGDLSVHDSDQELSRRDRYIE
jgi:hypothetical protein